MAADKEVQTIEIPTITLEWSKWEQWKDLEKDARGKEGVRVPNGKPGVYEVKSEVEEQRLTIGRAANLRMRVKQAMVKGKAPHSAGCKIRAKEDTSRLQVRWATTDRPAAAEEELHRLHIEEFEELPTYTQRT